MANEVRIRAWLKDEVTGKLGKVTDKFDHLGKSKGFQSIAMGVGMGAGFAALGALQAAVGGVTQVLGDATKAALEEEASVKKLDAALVANVKNFDGNTEAIEETLAARMRLGFADDEQRDSLARLVSVTKDSTKALQLQRQAMDLARLRGIDLAAASDIVGKVYGGNIGILARYGIQLEKGVTATEALAEVQRRAAGQAEAYANTNAGKLLASQIKVGEAMEKLGAVTLPAVVTATGAAADAIEDLSGVLDGLSVDIPIIDRNLFDLAQTARDLSTISTPLLNVNGIFELLADTADGLGVSTEAVRNQLRGMGIDVESEAARMASVAEKMADLSNFPGKMADQMLGNSAVFGDAAGELGEDLAEGIEDGKKEAVKIARATPQELADALRDKRTSWQRAVEQLGEDIENKMSVAKEKALIQAELTGSNIAKGLRSKDPVVRAQANATRKILTDRLAELNGFRWGDQLGESFVRGMRSNVVAVQRAARLLATTAANYLKFQSPAKEGPGSEAGGPEGWGRNFGEAFAKGIAGTNDKLRGAVDTSAGGLRPMGMAGVAALATGGAVLTVNVVSAGVLSPAHGQAIAREIGPHLRDYLNRRG